MKSAIQNCIPTVAVAALVVNCALPACLTAGEAIQFSNARNRQDPTAKPKFGTEKENSGPGPVSPFNHLPDGGSRRRDPMNDRKAKNAAAERANWMVLDRGQLDAEDEEKRAYGIRESAFEKDPDQRDYFFGPKDDKTGFIGAPRPLFARDPKEAPAEAPKDGTDTQRGSGTTPDGKPAPVHTAKELDLKDLLSPGKANSLAPSVDKTALMWKEVFGSGEARSDSARRRDEPTTADSFRGSLPSFSAARSAEPFTPRADLNRPAAVSTPGLSGSAARNIAPSTAPMTPRVSDSALSRSPGPYNAPGAGGSSFNSRNGSFGTDPNPGSSRPSQNRSSSGNYQIPSRPGYDGR